VAITPDTKNWTWVLERRCPECGFDSSSLSVDQIAPLLRTTAETWVAVLARPHADLRRRPSDDRWSALEYGCHVRDVFVLFETRLRLMLTEDNPTFANWDQDRTAVDDHYNDQDPATVASELAAAGAVMAASFASLDDAAWQRRGARSDGSFFTVDSFGRYMIHDPVHHIHDVTVDGIAVASSGPD
jgi:DinB superfamily